VVAAPLAGGSFSGGTLSRAGISIGMSTAIGRGWSRTAKENR
jgi:hypothetical protein